ncbi:MAG: FeoB small GTPase domain-containing protein [Methanofollis sp.]|uniref:FeoB small GTPase domain-containing protein n=1 Tax=Methanofollis sp. TaxID=2052835 RepID=UPI0026103FB6|nr:FeoB small GTPase domain-containing protein [Methanofollis sp.]MDD4255747.1 FeoB small GTPase domain-containing protein [Methanofollis sp.]
MSKKHTNSRTVLMVGNPNVGKSALFNRLTGAEAVVSNYPGTTVDVMRGTLVEGGATYEIIDVPGAYSLEPRDAAEDVAVHILKEHPDAVVLLVLDATRLERGLYLGFEVIERGAPVLVVLNMMDAARAKSIAVDARRLQNLLGVPVVQTSATVGEGIKDLAGMLRKAQTADIDAIAARANGSSPETARMSRCSGCAGCGGCH